MRRRCSTDPVASSTVSILLLRLTCAVFREATRNADSIRRRPD
jgi:hypothetical protein